MMSPRSHDVDHDRRKWKQVESQSSVVPGVTSPTAMMPSDLIILSIFSIPRYLASVLCLIGLFLHPAEFCVAHIRLDPVDYHGSLHYASHKSEQSKRGDHGGSAKVKDYDLHGRDVQASLQAKARCDAIERRASKVRSCASDRCAEAREHIEEGIVTSTQ